MHVQNPLTVPDNAELSVSMWRKTDDRRVWYEWIVDVFVNLPSPSSSSNGKGNAHNGHRGKKVRVSGSELHSSEKDACLM